LFICKSFAANIKKRVTAIYLASQGQTKNQK